MARTNTHELDALMNFMIYSSSAARPEGHAMPATIHQYQAWMRAPLLAIPHTVPVLKWRST